MLFPKLADHLASKGFTTEQIDTVEVAFINGLAEADLKFESGAIIAGSTVIKFLNPDNGGDVTPGTLLRSQYWEAHIGNLPPHQIQSVKIPELRYDSCEALTFKVSIYPEAPDFPKLFKKKEDKK